MNIIYLDLPDAPELAWAELLEAHAGPVKSGAEPSGLVWHPVQICVSALYNYLDDLFDLFAERFDMSWWAQLQVFHKVILLPRPAKLLGIPLAQTGEPIKLKLQTQAAEL